MKRDGPSQNEQHLDGQHASESGARSSHHETDRVSWIEWAIAGLGVALVLLCVCFLVYDIATKQTGPARIVLRIDDIVQQSGSFVVQVRASNDGAETAEALAIEGRLMDGETIVETTEVTIDHVPAGSERAAALVFTMDPRAYEVRLRTEGYRRP